MDQAQAEPIRLINRAGLQSNIDPTKHRSPIVLVIALAPLDLLAGLQLLPVYGSLPFWLTVGTAACLTGLLIAMLPRRGIATALLQPLLLIAAQFLLGPIFALNGTTLAHIWPYSWPALAWAATWDGQRIPLPSWRPPCPFWLPWLCRRPWAPAEASTRH